MGCWPTAAAGPAWLRCRSCSTCASPPQPSPWSSQRPTMSPVRSRPHSCAATAGDRWRGCCCLRPSLPFVRHRGRSRDDQFARSKTSANQRRAGRLAPARTRPRPLAANASDLSRPRTSSSALPGRPRTADIVVAPDHRGRAAQITIATQTSTTTVACAAVSSLEACPTPALRPVQLAALPQARAGVRQPLTAAPVRLIELLTYGLSSAVDRGSTTVRDCFGESARSPSVALWRLYFQTGHWHCDLLIARSLTCGAVDALASTDRRSSTCVQLSHSVRGVSNDIGDDLRRWLDGIDQAAGLAGVQRHLLNVRAHAGLGQIG
jgi:hypothetical protein